MSKKMYYESFFSYNINNMKKTWEGIQDILDRKKSLCKTISVLRNNHGSPLVHNPSKIPNMLNLYFASCGSLLAAKLPHSEKH